LIRSTKTINFLSTIVDKSELPENEGQVRALQAFDEDLQPAILRTAQAQAKKLGANYQHLAFLPQLLFCTELTELFLCPQINCFNSLYVRKDNFCQHL
jgi:hypothetical protein